MAEKLLVEKSEELLCKFFRQLNENERKHVGLMGGWAVHFLLKSKGVEHIGSRDIDIFFDPKRIRPQAVSEKLDKMGFHPHSTFRWVKIFHSETEKELDHEQSKRHPLHNLSYVYFDIATPTKIEHSMPEPFLKKVLEKEKRFITLDGLKILVPSPKALVEIKLKSSIQRTDSFKRAKDLADLFALLQNFGELWQTKKGIRTKTKGLNKKSIKAFKQRLEGFKIDGAIAATANMLNANQETIIQLFEKI